MREVLAAAHRRATDRSSGSAGETPASAQLVLGPAVVSLATLADRLSGVRRRGGREEGGRDAGRPRFAETTQYYDQPLGRCGWVPTSRRLAVGVCDTSSDPAALVRLVAPLASEIERLAKTGLASVVAELTDDGGERRTARAAAQRKARRRLLPGQSPARRASGGGPRSGRSCPGGRKLGLESAGRRSGTTQPVSTRTDGKAVFAGRGGTVPGAAERATGIKRTGRLFWTVFSERTTMRIGKVIGTVTLSRSHPSLAGASYRMVVPLSLDNLIGPDAGRCRTAGRLRRTGSRQRRRHRVYRRGRSDPALLSRNQADRRLQRRPARRHPSRQLNR